MAEIEIASTMPAFQSQLPYVPERIGAAAVYCSDGRVGEHFDDFLHAGLGLPRYDRIALPGGPACLAGHVKARLNEQAVVEELRFLVGAHGVNRIVLIAHHGCAFYAERLHLEVERMEAAQKADLAKAARFIYRATGLAAIESYFARPGDGHIAFEPVEAGPLKPF
ncbi:MAG: hypothetical protein HYR64_06415 [Fimbriimonas ginsengisoli]|uniref:Carbonic anhydrase n=1 Tax=Fimbriimonas ginsengisoli TaxID=1005039 RepID=A0A931LSX0_FIMGI|nr:hypothetical protein [Fimbriimonas ginsengisoli]